MPRRESQELGLADGASNQSIVQFQGGENRPQESYAPDHAALQGLLGIGKQVASATFDKQAEEAYLRGGIAAAQGQSAEDVNSDPVTRAFTRGGFNDESYRLVQTKETQDFKVWLDKEGHKLAPDDPRVTERLRRASTNTLSAITPKMTSRARAEALMSQNKSNETLLSQHNKAYKEYSVAEYARRVVPQGNQNITTLVNAMSSGDHATYRAASDKAALYYTDISNDERLSPEMRQEISSNFLMAMVNADQRIPVENMRDSGILDSLPFDTREKVNSAIEASKNRTLVKDLGSKIADNAYFAQGAAEGKYSNAQIGAQIQKQYKEGSITLPQAMNLYDSATKGIANRERTTNIIAALNRRQLSGSGGLYELGTDAEEGLSLMIKQLRLNKVSDAEVLGITTGIGLDLGHLPKENAEAIGAAVRAIGAAKPDQMVNPDFVATLNLATSFVKTAGDQAPYKQRILLENMPEDTKGAMAYVLEQAQYNVKPDQALRNFWANQEKLQAMPDAAKQRHTDTWKTKYNDAINQEFPRAWFGNFFTGLVGGEARIDDSDLSNIVITNAVHNEMQFQERNPGNLGVSEDSLVSIASSEVRKRMIPIADGSTDSTVTPLLLERGADVNAMFGSRDRAAIGQALAKAYPAANENLRSVFVWDKNNKQLVNKQVDEHNMAVSMTAVNLSKVKDSLAQARIARDEEESAANFGGLRKIGDASMTIDGRNSAGVPTKTAYRMRDLLLQAAPDSAANLAGVAAGEVTVPATPTDEAGRLASMAARLTDTGAPASAAFRNTTDLVLLRTARHVAPEYEGKQTLAVIAAAVAVDGPEKMMKVMQQANAAIANRDDPALQRALSEVSNETLRNALLQDLRITNSILE